MLNGAAEPKMALSRMLVNECERREAVLKSASALKIRKDHLRFHDTGFECAPTSVEACEALLTRDRILVTQANE